MKTLQERLEQHLQSIRENDTIKQELTKILNYAKEEFRDNESQGKGEQVEKALKLLELIATEDLKAKAENRKFKPSNIRIDIKKLSPDPVVYVREHNGFWDGGDDEDYFTCCFDYGGDGDLLGVGKKVLSKEARHFLEDQVEKAMKIAWDRLDAMYDDSKYKNN